LTTGALLAVAAVVAGVLTGERLGPRPARALVVGVALTLVVAAVLTRHRRRGLGPLLLLALALAGVASMQRALDGLSGPVAALARERAEVTVAARFTGDPASRFAEVRVPVRLEAVARSGVAFPCDGRNCNARTSALVLVAARGATASRLRLLSAGDVVVVSGELEPLGGWEERLRWRHLAARLEASDLVALGPAPSGLLGLAGRLRGLIQRGTATLPATERALVAGFLLGDTRELPGDVAGDFRASGLSHLLAVSGANVALALALAAPVLRRLGLGGRLVGGGAILVVFAAMTRFEPSVLRASAMAGLSLLAVFLGRPASAGRLLALAVAGLLLADPFLVHSLGFRLSVAASAGIVAWARPLAGRLPGPSRMRQALAVTAAAQLGVAPVAIPAFGSLPLAALPANLVAAPLSAALAVWGMGAGLVGGLLAGPWPRGAALLQVPSGALAATVAEVASIAARLPGRVSLPQGLLALSALAAATWRASARRRRPLQSEEPIQRGLARADEHQGQGPGGDHQVELVAAALARRADEAQVPLHLEDDRHHLSGEQEAPQPGEQTGGDEDPAHQLDDDHGVGHQLGEGHVDVPDDPLEAGHPAVDLAPAVVGHDGPDHQAQGQGGQVGVPPGDGEANRSHGGSP
jgi:competence protein ComEC